MFIILSKEAFRLLIQLDGSQLHGTEPSTIYSSEMIYCFLAEFDLVMSCLSMIGFSFISAMERLRTGNGTVQRPFF